MVEQSVNQGMIRIHSPRAPRPRPRPAPHMRRCGAVPTAVRSNDCNSQPHQGSADAGVLPVAGMQLQPSRGQDKACSTFALCSTTATALEHDLLCDFAMQRCRDAYVIASSRLVSAASWYSRVWASTLSTCVARCSHISGAARCFHTWRTCM